MKASHSSLHNLRREGFTLIELLVVIAIIAILAVVVVLTLNPAELLRQSRDANRVSDMATLQSAISLYVTDQSGASLSLGSSSVVYVSIPDPSATSTAGTNCASLGLPTLPATYTYHCAASSTFRNMNGQGWVPVNFSNISAGSPFTALPVDPTNQSSSRLYYTYTTNGTQFEVTAAMESSKYQLGGSNDQISGDGAPLATVYAKGTNLTLEPLDYGDPTLVGYWPLNEGANAVAYDESGNNATGSWSGTRSGSNGYYGAGENQAYAGYFDGSDDYITVGSGSSTNVNDGNFTLNAWVDANATGTTRIIVERGSGGAIASDSAYLLGLGNVGKTWVFGLWNAGVYDYPSYPSVGSVTPGVWYMVTGVYNLSANSAYLYVNGTLVASSVNSSYTPPNLSADNFVIGASGNTHGASFNGYIEGVSIYDRALTSAQIAALYNGGK